MGRVEPPPIVRGEALELFEPRLILVSLTRTLVNMLSGKYNQPMKGTKAIAAALGRRGGQARARRLSQAERRRIAALGGVARGRSLEIARRIADNFAYVSATLALAGRQPAPARISTCKGPLPGLYPKRT